MMGLALNVGLGKLIGDCLTSKRRLTATPISEGL